MADLSTEHDLNAGAANHDDAGVGNGDVEQRGTKRRARDDDDDDDEDGKPGKERRKIDIKFISDKSRRHITFSKRKAGIMKKAYELSVLTGTQVLLLVVSETGLVYTFTTPKLQPLVTKAEGKNLIQACLNAPSPTGQDQNGLDDDNLAAPVDSPEEQKHNQMAAAAAPGMPRNPQVPGGYPGMPTDSMPYGYNMGAAGMPPQPGQYAPMPNARMGQHPQAHHQ